MYNEKSPLFFALLLAAIGSLAWQPISSAQIFMDVNGPTAGFGELGGSDPVIKIWNTTNENWNTNPSGEDGYPPDFLPPTLTTWNNTSGTTTFVTAGATTLFLGNSFTVSGLAVTNTSGNFTFRSDDPNAANTDVAITVTGGGEVYVPTGGTLQFVGTVTATPTLIGAFTKTGGGTLNYTANAATVDTFGTITSLTVQEGQMNLPRVNLLTATSTVALTGGILNLDGGRNYDIGSLSGTSGSIIWGSSANSRVLHITQITDQSFGGTIEGQAGGGLRNVNKLGDATLTLTGVNTYNGTMTISAGTLQVGNGGTTGSLSNTNTINNAALIFNRSNDSTYAQVISGSGTVTKTGAGTKTLTGDNTYSGATTVNGGTLLISGTGAINSTSGITVNNGGTLSYNSSTALNRNITLNSGGTFVHNGSSNYAGTTFTWNGGTLAGTNWNGSQLNNLTVGAGQIISPGNSPGTANTVDQTWAGGGSYLWEMNNATGTAGGDPGWDLVLGTGTLTITATELNPFTIYVTSLTVGNTSGDAVNFDNTQPQSWLIADFGNPILGFEASKFVIDISGFTNPILPGSTFAVVLGADNSQLFLLYDAIPEPGTGMLLLVGAGLLALRRRRSRNAAQ